MNSFLKGLAGSIIALAVVCLAIVVTGGMPSGGYPTFWLILFGVLVLITWIVALAQGSHTSGSGFPIRGLIFLVALTVAGGAGVFHLWREHVRGNEIAQIGLDKKLDEFCNCLKTQTGGAHAQVKKVVLIDLDKHCIDPLFFDLPNSLKPAKADDVDTVILLHWKQEHVGDYDNGARAMQWRCAAAAVDRKSGNAFTTREFIGSEPPKSTKSKSSDSGSKPEKDVLGFVQSLK